MSLVHDELVVPALDGQLADFARCGQLAEDLDDQNVGGFASRRFLLEADQLHEVYDMLLKLRRGLLDEYTV